MADCEQQLKEHVLEACAKGEPMRIVGGDSKRFLGRPVSAEAVSIADHSGILHYEPTELVITARAGTSLQEIENALAEHNQMLAFEPPHYGQFATLGGTIACNLSGPRRPFTGAARDFVLGTKIINGRGEVLKLGGEVMKNVAGYDVSRLMAGAYGTLGIMLEISLKVLPKPDKEITLRKEISAAAAIEAMTRWTRKSYPISAAAHDGSYLYIRLSSNEGSLKNAKIKMGGEEVADGTEWWQELREHQHAFFASQEPLWRLSVPLATAMLDLPGQTILDWSGCQRWLRSTARPDSIRKAVSLVGGHATLYRGMQSESPFQPLNPGILAIHSRLKQAFDPHGLFNPGRMYSEL